MTTKPAIRLLTMLVVIIVSLSQLFGSGEAQSTPVICLEWFALIGASLGLLGAIYAVATGKPLGAKARQP